VSDHNRPGDVPPDLPPEYAEAYRRGYERALSGEHAPSGDPEVAERTQVHGPLFADEIEQESPSPGAEPTQVFASFESVMATGAVESEEPRSDRVSADRPAWFVPALFGGLVVLLLVGAFGIGKLVSAGMSGGTPEVTSSDGLTMPDGGSPARHEATGEKYDGPTKAAAIGRANASCQAPSGVDAAGRPVSYAPANVYDGDLTTAWRCDGSGVGEKLTLDLADAVSVGEVGLVPGYAKTDPHSGADRYAENNRLTKVRWVFSDGSTVVQRLDGSARNRELQTMRIPATQADRVVVEILGSTRGPRNTVAISEVRIGKIS
jgi:hypothetical protein